VSDPNDIVSSDQALPDGLPSSATATSAVNDVNLFMTCSLFVLLVSVPVEFTQIV
jgi:hypothetical protein